MNFFRGSVILVASVALFQGALQQNGQASENEVLSYLADGFDFPVGYPDAVGYYKARGYWPNGHLGEDWNGTGGGDTDLGDPIYSCANGVVVFSDDVRKGWGNCVIIRHAYRGANGKIRYVDSQYGHLLKREVKLFDKVKKGQKIGEMGSNRGQYLAHLHFEMRHELRLGMARSSWPKDNSCYYDPTRFIKQHRKLRADDRLYPIPVNTFAGQGGDQPPNHDNEIEEAKNGLSKLFARNRNVKKDPRKKLVDDILKDISEAKASSGENADPSDRGLLKKMAKLFNRSNSVAKSSGD